DFTIEQERAGSIYRAEGSWERDGKPTGKFSVTTGAKTTQFDLRKTDELTPELRQASDNLLERVHGLAAPQQFFVETEANGTALVASGEVSNHHIWKASRLSVRDATSTRDFSDLSQVPEPYAQRFRNLLSHEGVEYVGLLNYARENGGLPNLD